MNETGIHWKSHTKYVDIDTGQILTSRIALDKHKYIILKTIKNAKTNANKTIGTVEYTKECRKQPQGKLPFG